MIGVDVSIENLTKPFKKLEVLQTMCIKHYESINKTSRSSLVYPEAVTQNCLRNPSKFFIDRGLGIFLSDEKNSYPCIGEGIKVMTQQK